LAAGLNGNHRAMMPILLTGMLFGRGRRTVTSWLRAAGVVNDYEDYYYFLSSLGRKTEQIATRVFQLVLAFVPLPDLLRMVIGGYAKRPFLRAAMVECWSWSRPGAELCDRSASPWDDPDRRPSHADRRKALQRLLLREQFSTLRLADALTRKTVRFVESLIGMAA
jgi:hypothetical protein